LWASGALVGIGLAVGLSGALWLAAGVPARLVVGDVVGETTPIGMLYRTGAFPQPRSYTNASTSKSAAMNMIIQDGSLFAGGFR
jgi:hypothetical protein